MLLKMNCYERILEVKKRALQTLKFNSLKKVEKYEFNDTCGS